LDEAQVGGAARFGVFLEEWPEAPAGEAELFGRLRDLCEEGIEISTRIEAARGGEWHSFIPAYYGVVLRVLLSIRGERGRFLEWGSAIGVIAIMADLLGFEAYGIEIAPELVEEAEGLAKRYDSNARFVAGSFVPEGYEFVSATGDRRLGTVGVGEAAYGKLGFKLSDFDWVHAYPWPGESAVLQDIMRQHGSPDGQLLLHGRFGGRGADVAPADSAS